MERLVNVQEINLIDNDLNPFEDAVLQISKMPKLDSLHLNLHEESQVDFVIRNLPNLKYLNGEEIDREELQNESSQSEPHSERIPINMGNSFSKINEVDEEQEGRSIEDTKSEKAKNIKKNSKIQNLNYTSDKDSSEGEVTSSILDCTDSEEICLKPEDLETVALIFDKIRSMHRKHKLSNDKVMADDFDKHLKSCMQRLSDTIMKNNISLHYKNSAILRTKFELGSI